MKKNCSFVSLINLAHLENLSDLEFWPMQFITKNKLNQAVNVWLIITYTKVMNFLGFMSNRKMSCWANLAL